jgi:hypothetical protein
MFAKKSSSGYGSDWGVTMRESDYKLEFHINSGSTDRQFFSSAALTASTWYHIALTYDGANLIGYINASATDGGTIAATGNLANAADAFWIGRHGSNSDARNWKGYIDDVAVFSRALSATEITSVYNSGTGRVLDTSPINVTVNLPTAVGNTALFTVKQKNTAPAVIDPDGSETVDGAATKTITVDEESLTVASDNANWHIISKYTP